MGEGDHDDALRHLGERAIHVGRGARRTARPSRRVTRPEERDGRRPPFDETNVVDEHRPEPRGVQRALHCVPPGVHVVIAGDHVDAQGRRESAQRACVRRDILGTIVDEVAGHGDQIRVERAGRLDDAIEEPPRRVRAHVQVGKLHDAQPVELRAEPGDFGVHAPYGKSAGAKISDEEHGSRDREDGSRERLARRDGLTEGSSDQKSGESGGGHDRQKELHVPERAHDHQAEHPAGIERPAAPPDEREEGQRRVDREDDHGAGRPRRDVRDECRQRSPRRHQVGDETHGDRRHAHALGKRTTGRHAESYPPPSRKRCQSPSRSAKSGAW